MFIFKYTLSFHDKQYNKNEHPNVVLYKTSLFSAVQTFSTPPEVTTPVNHYIP